MTIGARYRFVLMHRPSDPRLFEAEAAATAPVVRIIRRGQRQGEIDERLNPVFAAGQLAMLVIGGISLVDRGVMTIEEARTQALVAFGNAVVPRP